MMWKTMAVLLIASMFGASAIGDDGLRERLKDANGVRTDLWVYNDIAAGIEEARKQNKPLFVTFRCVPCKDCAAFDADVANGNERVLALAQEKFVSVRQVQIRVTRPHTSARVALDPERPLPLRRREQKASC